MKKILLVNPWIHDFAAYDLWLFPLGLLNIASFAQHPELKFFLLNFLDRFDSQCNITQKDTSTTVKFGTGHFLKQEINKPDAVESVARKFFRYGLPKELLQY